ncbi:MAG: hypothetical protein AAGG81_06565 [Chlamydiota bacterium]
MNNNIQYFNNTFSPEFIKIIDEKNIQKHKTIRLFGGGKSRINVYEVLNNKLKACFSAVDCSLQQAMNNAIKVVKNDPYDVGEVALNILQKDLENCPGYNIEGD